MIAEIELVPTSRPTFQTPVEETEETGIFLP